MTRSTRALALVALGLTAGTAACRKAIDPATPQPEAVPAAQTGSPIDSAAIRDSIARARQAEEDARRAAEEAANAGPDRERRLAELRAALGAPVYFDYNSYELSADARTTLDGKVAAMVANPGLRLRVSGHSDSRGSDEYNLALSQRRAAAVVEYLQQRGLEVARFEVVSMGEEMPAVPEENEGAWAQNRRAEFEIIAGALTNPGEN
jgi:peptidoglycan-associated lipoprotein